MIWPVSAMPGPISETGMKWARSPTRFQGGFLDTRPVVITGQHLYVNAEAAGEIRVEITSADGRTVLPGWGLAQCQPVVGDHARVELRWADRQLTELQGKSVRIRFHLKDAHLYSFWLEP